MGQPRLHRPAPLILVCLRKCVHYYLDLRVYSRVNRSRCALLQSLLETRGEDAFLHETAALLWMNAAAVVDVCRCGYEREIIVSV